MLIPWRLRFDLLVTKLSYRNYVAYLYQRFIIIIIIFFDEATMRFFPSMVLLIFFATFQLACGDENTVDSNHADVAVYGWKKQGEEITDLERENDEEQDDGAKYRWLAPELFDELNKRHHAHGGEPGEIKKKPKKNKKNKDKKKKKSNKEKKLAARRKSLLKGMLPT